MNRVPTNGRTDGGDLLTIEQLSEYLKVPTATIYAWRHEGVGPRALKAGRALRYRRADVDGWLARDEAIRGEG